MRIMLRAAMAAVSIASISSAYAGESEGAVANTQFTSIPGVVAHAPAQAALVVGRGSELIEVYGTRSSQGTWLFPPYGNAGANS